jgi:hypothetical protein
MQSTPMDQSGMNQILVINVQPAWPSTKMITHFKSIFSAILAIAITLYKYMSMILSKILLMIEQSCDNQHHGTG